MNGRIGKWEETNPTRPRRPTFLETAVTLYPSFAIAWYFMGGIRLTVNDADGARRAFEAALAADPRFPYAYVPLAAMELRARHYAEAVRFADSAVRLDHKLMDAHYYRALANTALGRHDVARHSIETILDSHNDRQYPAVHAMLAVILVTQSNFEAAANEYRKFLDLDPGSPAAAAARDYLSKWHADTEVPWSFSAVPLCVYALKISIARCAIGDFQFVGFDASLPCARFKQH